jgi:hypothetical protein
MCSIVTAFGTQGTVRFKRPLSANVGTAVSGAVKRRATWTWISIDAGEQRP